MGEIPASGRNNEAEEEQMDPRRRPAGMTEGRKMGMSDKGKMDAHLLLAGMTEGSKMEARFNMSGMAEGVRNCDSKSLQFPFI